MRNFRYSRKSKPVSKKAPYKVVRGKVRKTIYFFNSHSKAVKFFDSHYFGYQVLYSLVRGRYKRKVSKNVW